MRRVRSSSLTDGTPRAENVRKLKALEYLNLAMNNVTAVENLEKCEALVKLDLTMNFIKADGLMNLRSLSVNHNLRELFLMGNPCAELRGYRLFVIETLPQLTHLDGKEITHIERIHARRDFQEITRELRQSAANDYDSAMSVEEISSLHPDARPWCAATRVLDKNVCESTQKTTTKAPKHRAEHAFETLPEDIADVKQKNQGDFKFTLTESDDETAIQLEVHVGTFIDTSLVNVDIHPKLVRVKIKGELLQLKLSHEVTPDSSVAERSKATGKLLITMPKLNWHLKPKKIVNKRTYRDRGDCAVVTYHRTEDDAPPMVHR
tara:strand:+ start:2669 stop:3631 length:963 start_codon:yes stop_codon:yes gene_type:complete